MERYVTRHSVSVLSLVIAVALIFLAVAIAQEFPGIPKLPGVSKVPGLPGASQGFAGLGALTAAKELTAMKDKTTYPTPNIAVSGNHVVIAWPNGVVTIETLSEDGALSRTVLGPPTEENLPPSRR